MNNRPVGGLNSEAQSRPIDMNRNKCPQTILACMLSLMFDFPILLCRPTFSIQHVLLLLCYVTKLPSPLCDITSNILRTSIYAYVIYEAWNQTASGNMANEQWFHATCTWHRIFQISWKLYRFEPRASKFWNVPYFKVRVLRKGHYSKYGPRTTGFSLRSAGDFERKSVTKTVLETERMKNIWHTYMC
jgi:hypothetical protein